MSMRLSLAKIEAALLESVRADPGLIGAVLEGRSGGLPLETDVFADDHRSRTAIAEGRAEAEHGTARWRRCFPWLAAATGEDGANDVAGCEVGYGPPFVPDPAQVAAVARGLGEEGWGFGAGHAGGAYEGLEALAPFYAAAASEGKAVVGAVR
ncbi:hypothetical protein [Nonomuraea sp. NPDC001831]|uniref:hypothetical protein n=1 Tax=Nonomuraea sp. NPDC001831 TaxID=3364340 RepID=UPI00369B91B5